MHRLLIRSEEVLLAARVARLWAGDLMKGVVERAEAEREEVRTSSEDVVVVGEAVDPTLFLSRLGTTPSPKRRWNLLSRLDLTQQVTQHPPGRMPLHVVGPALQTHRHLGGRALNHRGETSM